MKTERFSGCLLAAAALILALNLGARAQSSAETGGDANLSPEGQAAQERWARLSSALSRMQEELEAMAVRGEPGAALAARLGEMRGFLERHGIVAASYFLTEDGHLIRTNYTLSEHSPEGERVRAITWVKDQKDPVDIDGVVRVRGGRRIIVWERGGAR